MFYNRRKKKDRFKPQSGESSGRIIDKDMEEEKKNTTENTAAEEPAVMEDVNTVPEENAEAEEAVAEDANDPAKEIEVLQEQIAKEKKEYLFLMAEFDNFRKRTLKEKAELIRNAGEQVLKGILPIMDDFERGLKASENADGVDAVREGMVLIYNKLKKYLEQNGVKEMDPEDKEFDADRHDAISAVPVPDETLKGKILDTVEKGYMLNDKVLRHAKVVVGQ